MPGRVPVVRLLSQEGRVLGGRRRDKGGASVGPSVHIPTDLASQTAARFSGDAPESSYSMRAQKKPD